MLIHISLLVVLLRLDYGNRLKLINSSDMDQRVQSASVSAIPAFTSQYYIYNGVLDLEARDTLLSQYFNMLK